MTEDLSTIGGTTGALGRHLDEEMVLIRIDSRMSMVRFDGRRIDLEGRREFALGGGISAELYSRRT